MVPSPTTPPRRLGWIAAAAAGTLVGVAVAVGGLWALAATVETGSVGWGVLTGTGAGLLFWAWIVAGCWRRAHEPEPDPYAPAPVPRSAAFVVANVVLAILFTAMVAGGLWAGVRTARDAERVDLISHRVLVAARAADVTVAEIRRLEVERQEWLAVTAGGEDPQGPDPADELLPVDGARVIDVAVGEDTAAVLFRPDDGPPCVVLDIDADDLISTRATRDCT